MYINGFWVLGGYEIWPSGMFLVPKKKKMYIYFILHSFFCYGIIINVR